jgi:hypothetical protein
MRLAYALRRRRHTVAYEHIRDSIEVMRVRIGPRRVEHDVPAIVAHCCRGYFRAFDRVPVVVEIDPLDRSVLSIAEKYSKR